MIQVTVLLVNLCGPVLQEQHAGTLERMKVGYLAQHAEELRRLRALAKEQAPQQSQMTEPELAAIAQQAVALDAQGNGAGVHLSARRFPCPELP